MLKFSNLDLIDKLNTNYHTCEFCSYLYGNGCRASTVPGLRELEKCDECFLFYSKNAKVYEKVFKRYKGEK